MNLYLSKGKIWTGTQADAKEAQGGKDFVAVDFPTDKPGLLKTLNDMPALFPGMFAGVTQTVSAPVALTAMASVPDDLDLSSLAEVAPNKVIRKDVPASHPADCPACNRSSRVAKMVVNSQAVVNIRADLEDINDMDTIDRILQMAMDRKRALFVAVEPETGALPAPRARVRVRAGADA